MFLSQPTLTTNSRSDDPRGAAKRHDAAWIGVTDIATLRTTAHFAANCVFSSLCYHQRNAALMRGIAP